LNHSIHGNKLFKSTVFQAEGQRSPTIDLYSSGSKYFLGGKDKISYEITKPFIPDDRWEIKNINTNFILNPPTQPLKNLLENSEWDSSFLAKVFASLPDGEYLIKKVNCLHILLSLQALQSCLR